MVAKREEHNLNITWTITPIQQQSLQMRYTPMGKLVYELQPALDYTKKYNKLFGTCIQVNIYSRIGKHTCSHRIHCQI